MRLRIEHLLLSPATLPYLFSGLYFFHPSHLEGRFYNPDYLMGAQWETARGCGRLF